MTTTLESFGSADVTPNPANQTVIPMPRSAGSVALEFIDGIAEFQGSEAPVSDLEVLYAADELTGPQLDLHKKFMEARLLYVTALGWREGISDDYDRYDADPNTLTVIKSREKSGTEPTTFVSGMRLTQIEDIDSSLTWHMLDETPNAQETIMDTQAAALATLQKKADNGELWDLTRLTPQIDGTVGLAEIAKGMHELFGAALNVTDDAHGKQPVWVFLTTDTFKKFLDSSGIHHDVLFTGMVSEGDQEVSHLCVTDPEEALKYAQAAGTRRHLRTVASFLEGYAKIVD